MSGLTLPTCLPFILACSMPTSRSMSPPRRNWPNTCARSQPGTPAQPPDAGGPRDRRRNTRQTVNAPELPENLMCLRQINPPMGDQVSGVPSDPGEAGVGGGGCADQLDTFVTCLAAVEVV